MAECKASLAASHHTNKAFALNGMLDALSRENGPRMAGILERKGKPAALRIAGAVLRQPSLRW
jgi:hypothetical protein